MSDRRPYEIALFGAGRIGSVHARSISTHPRTRLKYVVDPREAAAQELARLHGAAAVDRCTVFEDPDVAAIVIASSTDTHADLVEKGLNAGKAVFCEKPIDLSLARVEVCLLAERNSSAPLFVAFNRRFDPAIAELKTRITAGEIGELEMLVVISRDPDTLPTDYLAVSGGMFRDMTIHDFDMVRFLLGEEPLSVTATAAALTSPRVAAMGDVDTASLTLQCASGRMAVIVNSRRAVFGYDQRIEAYGSGGTLRTENPPRTGLVRERSDGVWRDRPPHFFIDRYARSYVLEWDHFVGVLDGRTSATPSGEDGRRALLLAEAALRSLRTGRRVEVTSDGELLA